MSFFGPKTQFPEKYFIIIVFNALRQKKAGNFIKLPAPFSIMRVLFLSEVVYCAMAAIFYGSTAWL